MAALQLRGMGKVRSEKLEAQQVKGFASSSAARTWRGQTSNPGSLTLVCELP
jgi:hypothetical protein